MKKPENLFDLVQAYAATVEAAKRSSPGAVVVTYDADTGEDLTPAPRSGAIVRVPWSDTAARALLGVGPVSNHRLGNDEYVLPMPSPWTEARRPPIANQQQSGDEYILEMPNPWGGDAQ